MVFLRHRKIYLLVIMTYLLSILSGCQSSSTSKGQESKQGSSESYMIQDATGYKMTFSKKPEKIVSLTVGSDEILLSLVSPERIKAITTFSDDPGISNVTEQAAKIKAKVKAEAENVIALQPDLVLMADWQPVELVQILRDAKIPVYVYHTPDTVDKIKENIINIAEAVGEKAKGQQIVAQMEEKLAKIREQIKKVPKDKQLVVLQYSTFGVTGSKKSIFNDIVVSAGLVNGAVLAGIEGHGVMSKEKMVEINPDILLLPSWDYDGKNDPQKYADQVTNDKSLQAMKAIKNSKVFILPDKHLNCLSQNVVLGIYDLVKAAYPELMPEV